MEENGGIYENNTNHLKLVIVKILEEITEGTIATDDYQRSFMDIGLDSFKMYKFVRGLTKKIKINSTLNVLTIFEHPTIDQLFRYIGSLFCGRQHSEVVITLTISSQIIKKI